MLRHMAKRMMMQGGAFIPWYLSGGVSAANCIAAYQGKGAASYAASKINLANPGTYDAADGAAFPAWNTAIGWTFTSAAQQYLSSNCPIDMKPASYIVRLTTNGVLADRSIIGGSNQQGLAFDITAATNTPRLVKQDVALIGSGTAGFGDTIDTVIGASYSAIGDYAFYTNGLDNGSGNNNLALAAVTLIIGAQYSGGVQENPYNGVIAALALYNAVLTPAQFLSLSTALAAL